jgi:hypothetical protein
VLERDVGPEMGRAARALGKKEGQNCYDEPPYPNASDSYAMFLQRACYWLVNDHGEHVAGCKCAGNQP